MQDRPTAAELLEIAAEFLEREVMPELHGRKQFHTRVTVNVLRILKREAELEDGHLRAEHARLAGLLGREEESAAAEAETLRAQVREMNLDLAARIRTGGFDDRFDDVLAALKQTVGEKISVSNPNWVAR
jgi:hypothetical protein